MKRCKNRPRGNNLAISAGMARIARPPVALTLTQRPTPARRCLTASTSSYRLGHYVRCPGVRLQGIGGSDRRFGPLIIFRSRSYFFKIKSYERNYKRIEIGATYTYSGLDFGHLVELSYMDFALSRICLSLALSTEHFLKVRLNQLIMNDPKPDLSETLVRRILHGDTSLIRCNP